MSGEGSGAQRTPAAAWFGRLGPLERRLVSAAPPPPPAPTRSRHPPVHHPHAGTGPRRAHLVVALGVAGVWAVLCANPLEFCVVLSSCAAAMLFVVTTCMNSIATKFDGVNTKIDASNAELRTAIAASNADVRTAIDAVGTSVANLRTDVATLQVLGPRLGGASPQHAPTNIVVMLGQRLLGSYLN